MVKLKPYSSMESMGYFTINFRKPGYPAFAGFQRARPFGVVLEAEPLFLPTKASAYDPTDTAWRLFHNTRKFVNLNQCVLTRNSRV